MKQSKFMSLNTRDVLRAFLIAFIYSFLEAGQKYITESPDWGTWAVWGSILSVSIKTAVSYVILNFFTRRPVPDPSPIGKAK